MEAVLVTTMYNIGIDFSKNVHIDIQKFKEHALSIKNQNLKNAFWEFQLYNGKRTLSSRKIY